MIRTRMSLTVLSVTLALTAACGDTTETPTETPTGTQTIAPVVCNTDWEDAGPNNRDSAQEDKEERMYPGADCMACHEAGGVANERIVQEDKTWTLAGTLFDSLDGEAPVSGATVEVTDAEGTVVTMTTNAAGNFYTRQAVVFPIAAMVTKGEIVKYMGEHPDVGSCNTCHKCDGVAGGKLYLPAE